VPRLIIKGQRYEALSSSALYENQYSRLLIQHAEVLFPGLIAVEFTPTVVYESIGKKPDLALIAPDYRRWWVGEVELGHHSLEGHVVPQVEVLSRAAYGLSEAEWLADRNAKLDLDGLRKMMLGAQPGVVVILNAPKPDWVPRLRPEAEVMVVEPFRSDRDQFIFRQNGVELDVGSSVLTICRVDPTLRRMLVVESPAAIADVGNEPFLVEYEGTVSSWRQLTTKGCVWLWPQRGSPFPRSACLALTRSIDGRMVFQDWEES
jgi:hypothetical protein